MRLAVRERWPLRELQQQLAGALFERTVLSPAKLSAPPRELHPGAEAVFKDACLKERLRVELHVVGGDVKGIHSPARNGPNVSRSSSRRTASSRRINTLGSSSSCTTS